LSLRSRRRARRFRDGPQWIHEIKFDGFRMRVVREADRVKLLTRNGADWTSRYRWIV
jgi:ATP-dependent DNA ligase